MTLTNRIVNRFNQGISELGEAYNALDANSINLLQEKLHNCGIAIYEAYEWGLKELVGKLKMQLKGKSQFASDVRVLENVRDSNYFKNVEPILVRHFDFTQKGIDIGLVNQNKPKVRNIAVHEGAIPFHDTLAITILEVRKFISYLHPSDVLSELPTLVSKDLGEVDPSWEIFIDAAESFSQERIYILVTDRLDDNDSDLILLSKLKWSLIIDLDPDSEESGFYKKTSTELINLIKVHLYTPEQNIPYTPFSSLYWLAARGITGRPSTTSQDIKEWRRKFKQLINQQLSRFASATEPPVTTIFMTDSPYAKDFCECVDNAFGGNNKFIYCVNDPFAFSKVVEEYEGEVIKITTSQIISGVKRFTQALNLGVTAAVEILLPGKDDSDVVLPDKEFRAIEEYLSVIHKNIIAYENSDQDRVDFLKGSEITWQGLNRRYDVDREATPKLIKLIENDLAKRGNSAVFLNYAPGFGGTTVVKRVAWSFHNQYPTLMVIKYEPKITATNIYKVYMTTNKPVLLVVENSQVSNDNIMRLIQEVKALTFPSTFLITQRSSSKAKMVVSDKSSSEIPMPSYLSNNECRNFIDAYKEVAPDRKAELEKISTSGTLIERHPFYIGLIAFLENFKGLNNYITKSLSDATPVQKQVAAYISLNYCYAKHESAPHLFYSVLLVPESATIKLENYLSTSLKQILIPVKLKDSRTYWRPVHHLVGKELIEQILAGTATDRRLWISNLTTYSLELIDLFATCSLIASNATIDILKRLFILKDDDEYVDSSAEKAKFSPLVEEIPSAGRILIFKRLVEVFPNESHFWAHLGRYYSKEDINIDEALKCFEEAISLSDNEDPLLFHMKGMCLVSQIRIYTRKIWGQAISVDRIRENIESIMIEAAELFKRSRDLRINEYGFVAHINMLTHLIDFGYASSGISKKEEFINDARYFWFRELLDSAEGLVEDAKRLYEGDESYHLKEYTLVKRCDQKISEIYGNYSAVIQGWNNLLSKDVYKPDIRRQIVRAYNRKSGGWDKIESRIISMIIDYMETNIKEEPHEGKNIYLWFQAAKRSKNIDLDSAILNVSTWNSACDSRDSVYYLYILHAVRAILKFSESTPLAEKLKKLSSEKNRFNESRNIPYEWYGKGIGLDKIKHISMLGPKDPKTQFYTNTSSLEPVEGHITKIEHSGKGDIELLCGLKAFFTPAHGNNNKGFYSGDENQKVKFYLAFSYDGLRAYKVESIP